MKRSVLRIVCCMSLFLLITLKVNAQEKVEKDSVLLETLVGNEDRKYSYYFLEGMVQKNKGNLDDAYALFTHCIEIDPAKAEAYYQIGALNMNMNQLPDALTSFQKAVQLDSLNYWYNESFFFALYNSPENEEEAIKQLELMTHRFPDKSALQFQLLDLYAQSQDYDKIIAGLNQLERKLGKSEQISMQKFKVYLLKNEEKKAFSEMGDLVSTYPNDLKYQVILADLYLNNGKKKQALTLLNKVLEQDPDFPMAIYALANYYNETDQKEKYISELEKILYNPKAEMDLKLNLMRQYIFKAQEDTVQIMGLFEKAIELNPADDQIPMLYTQYLMSQKKEKETKPVLEHILKLDPTNTPSRLMLLGMAIREDDYKKVIEICEGGILSSPGTIEFYFYLAIAYNQAEDYKKLLSTVSQALAVVDESTPKELISDFYALRGDGYHSLSQYDKLYEAYDKALEYNPTNSGVLNNYAYYLSIQRKDLSKAEAMSKKTVEAEPKNPTFLDTYAWILFELKRYTEAKVYIDAALENGGNESGVVIEHAGDIYFKLGEKEKALEYWIQAEELGAGSMITSKIKKKKYIAE
ncbi:tetratricopeptide repeat protein [Bacteroides coprosuis]|uniref:tetratricopeptide repeat protein n=1 Tax=Bacteroides coprosuis TaxID=151276 RepID=UPI001D3C5B51|nr:tetratricopeptide repeat protein [Bacteroides coprosuis]HJD91785.1 tetratricopeptide repeat protein [Bacteroides coprosuis]